MTLPLTPALGYIPTPIDRLVRGLKYAYPRAKAAAADLNIPVYRPIRSAFDNQLTLGSCVGHGVSTGVEELTPDGVPVTELSRLWLWEKAKIACGFTGNSGVYMDTACDIALTGIPAESTMPYSDAVVDPPLPDGLPLIDGLAQHSLIVGDVVEGTWAALRDGHPVVFGVAMGSDGFYAAMAPGAGLLIRDKGQRTDFAHCLMAWGVGPNLVVARNWWGEQVAAGSPLVDTAMTTWDIAFTHEAFRACVYEARALLPEAQPLPVDPKTHTLELLTDEMERVKREATWRTGTATKYRLQGLQRAYDRLEKDL